jgi:hypothetical protein
MSTHNWDHAKQHKECNIYSEEEGELGSSIESASGDSLTVKTRTLRQTSVHKLRSSCDVNQFEEIRNPESDIVEYSN